MVPHEYLDLVFGVNTGVDRLHGKVFQILEILLQ